MILHQKFRDDLLLQANRGIQEELLHGTISFLIAETISSDEGIEKRLIRLGYQHLSVSQSTSFMPPLSADANQQSIFYQKIKKLI